MPGNVWNIAIGVCRWVVLRRQPDKHMTPYWVIVEIAGKGFLKLSHDDLYYPNKIEASDSSNGSRRL
jgi:hypothetical protein